MSPAPEEAARLHRLRSLADMASGMAHEFNQPLTAIRGCAENLLIARQRGWDIPPERIDAKLATIVEQCDRISGLIEHMRAFARGAAELRPAPLALAEAVADALRMIGSQLAQRGISVEVEDHSAGRLALAARHALAEVVVELLRNARDALAGAGRTRARIAVAIEPRGAELELRVRDDGPGMAAGTAEASEAPFAGAGAGGGPGLGLPAARHTMAAMGGSLRIETATGVGTTVILVLPAAA